jgi:hypothetical protein
MLLLFQRGLIMHNLHITLTQQTLVSQQPRSSHPPNVLIIPTTAILYSKEKRQDSLPQLPDATGKCNNHKHGKLECPEKHLPSGSPNHAPTCRWLLPFAREWHATRTLR